MAAHEMHGPEKICETCVAQTVKRIRDILKKVLRSMDPTRSALADGVEGYSGKFAKSGAGQPRKVGSTVAVVHAYRANYVLKEKHPVSKPARAYIVFGKINHISFEMVQQAIRAKRTPNWADGISNECCVNRHKKPHVSFDGAIIRTSKAIVSGSHVLPASIEFGVTIYPHACMTHPSIRAPVYPLVRRLQAWAQRAKFALEDRNGGDSAISSALPSASDIETARAMVADMFTTSVGDMFVKPERILTVKSSRRPRDVLCDIHLSDAVENGTRGMDLVLLVQTDAPLPIVPLLDRWGKRRPGLTAKVDVRWEVTYLAAEKPDVSRRVPAGACFVGLVFLSDRAQLWSSSERRSIKRTTRPDSDAEPDAAGSRDVSSRASSSSASGPSLAYDDREGPEENDDEASGKRVRFE